MIYTCCCRMIQKHQLLFLIYEQKKREDERILVSILKIVIKLIDKIDVKN